jgi:arsenate reductase
LHFGFEDPSFFTGTEEEILNEFRKIRDEIRTTFYKLYKSF